MAPCIAVETPCNAAVSFVPVFVLYSLLRAPFLQSQGGTGSLSAHRPTPVNLAFFSSCSQSPQKDALQYF